MLQILAVLLTFGILACSSERKSGDKVAPSVMSERFSGILSRFTEAKKHLDPYEATYFNVEEDLNKFGDFLSDSYFERDKVILRTALSELSQVDVNQLKPSEQVAFKLFKSNLEIDLKGYDFPFKYLSIDQMWSRLLSFEQDTSPELTSFPFDSSKHYRDFIQRAEGFQPFIDRQIAVLKEGIQKKTTLNCTIAKNVPKTYKKSLEKNIEKHPFYRPVLHFPASVTEGEQAGLKKDFKEMIAKHILPGYQKFNQFFVKEYIPHCRKGYGYSSLPQGVEWYNYAIRRATNTTKTGDEIHQIGLGEVARIRTEMDAVKTQMKFKGSLKAFFDFMRNNPSSYFKSREETLKAFNDIRKKIESKIPQYFELIPKTDYKIVESENPEDAAASYREPTELLPYGRFVVATMNLKSNPSFGTTTLSLHEAIPGHHFQLALQFEMKDQLTEYQRKLYFSNAFVEGWALYSEYLGREMGLYEDPAQKFGHLSDEMLRAVRLVVDTGIHAKNWSRAKAIAYGMDNMPMDKSAIEKEMDRYSVWPGQALAYKIGQLKILELRKLAETELGPRFDIKKFHRVVIGTGTLSLDVLEEQVKNWIKTTQL